MLTTAGMSLIRRKYHDAFGAKLTPSFVSYTHRGTTDKNGAALGYKRAGHERLFLEGYLDQPVELVVSEAFGRKIARDRIVEIGNLAASSPLAMVELWASVANDLGEQSEIAVATLTAPLRCMFLRIGLPLRVLASASRDRLSQPGSDWGSYYDLDPQVCAGNIAEGQQALAAFLQRRQRERAA